MFASHTRDSRGLGFQDESISRLWPVLLIQGILLAFLLVACSGVGQLEFDAEHNPISLGPNDLASAGLGFLTPTAATGREADKQALAMIFAKQLQELRPEIRVTPLAKIVSAVNSENLNTEYRQMYEDYMETAVLDGVVLRKVADASNVRYLAILSLAGFRQETRGRFSLLGLRLFDTKQANMRVFLQIWDSHNGSVAWEGGQELNLAYESSREKPVTFHDIAKIAAKQLYSRLPGANADQ